MTRIYSQGKGVFLHKQITIFLYVNIIKDLFFVRHIHIYMIFQALLDLNIMETKNLF